uniref:Uncharacterized protein n=1 Tax=Candidatus Kentrum eta TaxID=2126337 RepID=A0A450VIH7_9GAMM|nr:MAG: hypothetical protein BECKH772A_GA0070896_104252 [Candidatus Kentron sp. H]VFK04626.1 MAG: hypothetical protein BECKH772B_GA0070898_104672 [Candidatus Kentron sp. H]VFK07549.1 MAG: hypothetical protein BECKH772C_GA0070978_104312 [Candidatus Kentron sp. H]
MIIDKRASVHGTLAMGSNELSVLKVNPHLNMIWLFFLIALVSVCWVQPSYAEARLYPAPESRDWSNPYQMLTAKELNGNPEWPWEVFAAYQGAPMERCRGASSADNAKQTRAVGEIKPADYLERFVVLDRLSTKLQVRSMIDQRVGWMDMRDLLLFTHPLRNPRDIALKAFLRVDLGRRGMAAMQGEEKGVDLLRFRNGPGIPGHGNDYEYLVVYPQNKLGC